MGLHLVIAFQEDFLFSQIVDARLLASLLKTEVRQASPNEEKYGIDFWVWKGGWKACDVKVARKPLATYKGRILVEIAERIRGRWVFGWATKPEARTDFVLYIYFKPLTAYEVPFEEIRAYAMARWPQVIQTGQADRVFRTATKETYFDLPDLSRFTYRTYTLP